MVTVYLDVLDENGEAVQRLAPAELTAEINGQPLKVKEVTPFDASGEGVAYIFLVDVSKSIGSAQFAQIRQAIGTWIDGMKSADRMAIFTFGAQYRQIVGFTGDKARLKSALPNLKPTDLQTKFYLALNSAMNLSRQTTAGLPSRRAIVILTDGKDEGSGITAEDVRDVIQQSHVPIYAIGYSRLPAQQKETYLQVLNRFATLSGGIYSGATSLKTAYADMEAAIRRMFVVRLECEGCRADSQAHPLELTLTAGSMTRTSSQNVNVLAPSAQVAKGTAPATPEPEKPTENDEPWWKVVLSWKALLSLGLVIGVGVGVVFHVELKGWLWPPPKMQEKPVENVAVDSEPMPTAGPALVSGGRRVEITVLAGNERGRGTVVSLGNRLVVGRERGCDVSYPEDTEMSGRHFELIRVGPHIEVADLGSTNGTLLNGAQLVNSQRLRDGDLVRAGRTEVRINFDGER